VFNIGDKITWSSQSGGYEKRKTGRIIAILEPGADMLIYLPETAKVSHRKGDRFSQNKRYLVAVPRPPRMYVTDYYTPSITHPSIEGIGV
jgi:hypothetical protein